MGLFDKLRAGREVTLTPQGGLLLAAITMVAVDGDIGDDEIAIVRRLDGGRSTTDWEAAVKVWRTSSLEECMSLATNALNPEQRLATLANLVDIAMSDGELAGAERDLLEAYVGMFGVREDEVAKLVDVVAIKNNKSIFES